MEDKLVNKIFKGLIRFLIEVIVMTVLIVGINIFTNGMYLWGLPRINDIQSVNITYPSVTDDVKEISSSEDIELALKLTGFLKYDLFGEVNSEEEPAITITYFLKDGTSKTISANNTTVWWNNKIHVIKDKEMFINLTEGSLRKRVGYVFVYRKFCGSERLHRALERAKVWHHRADGELAFAFQGSRSLCVTLIVPPYGARLG